MHCGGSCAPISVAAKNAHRAVSLLRALIAIGMIVVWLLTTPGGYSSPFRARRGQIEREM